MANDISKITTPDGTVHDLKDAYSRSMISTLSEYTKYLGVTTTALADGDTTNPITINGSSVTAERGGIVTYESKEFIFNGTAWQEFGDLSGLGDMAFADTASASFTPAGSVAAPTISLDSAGSTVTIHNPTKETVVKSLAAAAPGQTPPSNPLTYYSVDGETLKLYQLGCVTGDSITVQDVTVKTGDASYSASAPAFTGTQDTIQVEPDVGE